MGLDVNCILFSFIVTHPLLGTTVHDNHINESLILPHIYACVIFNDVWI